MPLAECDQALPQVMELAIGKTRHHVKEKFTELIFELESRDDIEHSLMGRDIAWGCE
jgi:hypothetical protein